MSSSRLTQGEPPTSNDKVSPKCFFFYYTFFFSRGPSEKSFSSETSGSSTNPLTEPDAMSL